MQRDPREVIPFRSTLVDGILDARLSETSSMLHFGFRFIRLTHSSPTYIADRIHQTRATPDAATATEIDAHLLPGLGTDFFAR